MCGNMPSISFPEFILKRAFNLLYFTCNKMWDIPFAIEVL